MWLFIMTSEANNWSSQMLNNLTVVPQYIMSMAWRKWTATAEMLARSVRTKWRKHRVTADACECIKAVCESERREQLELISDCWKARIDPKWFSLLWFCSCATIIMGRLTLQNTCQQDWAGVVNVHLIWRPSCTAMSLHSLPFTAKEASLMTKNPFMYGCAQKYLEGGLTLCLLG